MQTYKPIKPGDPSANKPIYVVIAEDSTSRNKYAYYLTKFSAIKQESATLSFRGQLITKEQSEKLRENPNQEMTAEWVDRVIPWSRVVRMDNIAYSKGSKE